MQTFTASAFRAELFKILNSLSKENPDIEITRSGKPTLMISLNAPAENPPGVPPLRSTKTEILNHFSEIVDAIVGVDARYFVNHGDDAKIYFYCHPNYESAIHNRLVQHAAQHGVDLKRGDELT